MKKWYIIYHPARLLSSLQDGLERLKVEYFMPTIQEYSLRTDRPSLRPKRPKPLFPCYIFILIDPNITHPSTIYQLNGVTKFIQFGDEFYTISQEHINAIKCINFRMLHQNEEGFSCINPSPTLLKRMKEIYKTTCAEQRVASLWALLQLSQKVTD